MVVITELDPLEVPFNPVKGSRFHSRNPTARKENLLRYVSFPLSQGVGFSEVGEFVECLHTCVFLFGCLQVWGFGSLLS